MVESLYQKNSSTMANSSKARIAQVNAAGEDGPLPQIFTL